MSTSSRKFRRAQEGDGRFRPPKGWAIGGVGRWHLGTRHRGGSATADSAMRLVFGQIAGTALARRKREAPWMGTLGLAIGAGLALLGLWIWD